MIFWCPLVMGWLILLMMVGIADFWAMSEESLDGSKSEVIDSEHHSHEPGKNQKKTTLFSATAGAS